MREHGRALFIGYGIVAGLFWYLTKKPPILLLSLGVIFGIVYIVESFKRDKS